MSVRAPSLDVARDLAFAIERQLFDRGRIATVIDGGSSPNEAGAACARAGIVALVPSVGEDLSVTIEGETLRGGDESDVDALALRWAAALSEQL